MKASPLTPLVSATAIVWLLTSVPLDGAQVADVQRRLQAGEKITFIDVRSTDFFARGRIPGALNVPTAIVADKRLPRLGRVIVYDDGIGNTPTAGVVEALNRKPGIQAELLEGGYAAWVAAKGATTTGFGMTKEEIPMITYRKLKDTPTDDLVLVDLRKPPVTQSSVDAKSAAPAPLTDLRSEFPGAVVTKSPFNATSAKRSATGGSSGSPLLVLVDNGDGTAEQTARALKANGITRFVILAGGESTLARGGQPGLQRQGHTVEAPQGVVPPGAPRTP